MLFSSIVFLLYFLPLVLALYLLLKFSRPAQNALLLFASLLFYCWGEPKYVLVMLFSIAANYCFGLLIASAVTQQKAKNFLALGVFVNLLCLFYFKYTYFFVRSIDPTGYLQSFIPEIILPLGISFYTFQAISYIIDVYRGDVKVQMNPIYLGMYIAFFPQLIAGPIVRYSLIADQIMNRQASLKKFSVGFCRFVTGLGKKILIANSMAIVADHIYNMASVGTIPASLAWLGSISYTLQIYYDFSAYSDMAIGLGLMFGFSLPENFNYPYISKSLTEFWRRWHMTLGEWFRDYVYFPLGGSHVKNTDILIRNLFIVWLLTGIWHGAEWTFVFWGLFNFFFIALEKLFFFEDVKGHDLAKHIYLLFLVNLGWVIFRSDTLVHAGVMMEAMLGFNGFWDDQTWMFVKEFFIFYLAAILFSFPLTKRFNKMLVERSYNSATKLIMAAYPLAILGIFALSLTYLVKGTYNPFIYFRF